MHSSFLKLPALSLLILLSIASFAVGLSNLNIRNIDGKIINSALDFRNSSDSSEGFFFVPATGLRSGVLQNNGTFKAILHTQKFGIVKCNPEENPVNNKTLNVAISCDGKCEQNDDVKCVVTQ